MNPVALWMMPALAITGITFAAVPRLTPRTVCFGVRVASGFHGTPAAKRALLAYEAQVLAWLAVAVVVVTLWPTNLAALMSPLMVTGGGVLAYYSSYRRVRPFVSPASSVREAELSAADDGLPWWAVLGLAPFAVLAAAAAYLRANWHSIPGRFPVHWGVNGQPNRWAERTAHGVYGPLGIGAGLAILMLAIAAAMYFGARRSRVRTTTLAVLIGSACFVSLMLAGVSLMPVLRFPPLLLIVLPLVFVAAVLAAAIRVSADPRTEVEQTPDECWRAGMFYYNPRDPALFVQKRFGFGYTANFANPWSWVVIGLVPASIFGLAWWLK